MSCSKPDRTLSGLDPLYRDRFRDYLDALEETFPQFNFIVTETNRSEYRQECLRKSGASRIKVSNHQHGHAMDIAIYRHETGSLDWRPAVYRNVYRVLDPREFGLTSGSFLWRWDDGHLQIVEAQGRGQDLTPEMEFYGY